MNYQKHYTSLVNRAKFREIDGYFERHHVIPPHLGGTNRLANLVELTPKEHFIAHLLLCKIYPNDTKISRALCAFKMNQDGKRNSIKWTSFVSKLISQGLSQKRLPWGLGKVHPSKGKTMAEIVGPERAAEIFARKSAKLKGRHYTDKWKDNISTARTGKQTPLETREKISKALKGKSYEEIFGDRAEEVKANRRRGMHEASARRKAAKEALKL